MGLQAALLCCTLATAGVCTPCSLAVSPPGSRPPGTILGTKAAGALESGVRTAQAQGGAARGCRALGEVAQSGQSPGCPPRTGRCFSVSRRPQGSCVAWASSLTCGRLLLGDPEAPLTHETRFRSHASHVRHRTVLQAPHSAVDAGVTWAAGSCPSSGHSHLCALAPGPHQSILPEARPGRHVPWPPLSCDPRGPVYTLSFSSLVRGRHLVDSVPTAARSWHTAGAP